MFFICFLNVLSNCCLSEHGIRSQVHMIQAQVSTDTQSFPQVFPQESTSFPQASLWYSSRYQLIQAQLYQIIHLNVAKISQPVYVHIIHEHVHVSNDTLTDSEIYARLRRVGFLKINYRQVEFRSFSKVLPQTWFKYSKSSEDCNV